MKAKTRYHLCAVLGFGAGAVLASAPVAAGDLQSHAARYALSLSAVEEGSPLTNVTGELSLEWEGSCTGYVLNQSLRLTIDLVSGATFESGFLFSSWEALDRTSFRFASRLVGSNQSGDQTVGKASFDSLDQDGRVVFEKPEATEMVLPMGTLFPTALTEYVITAAQNGDMQVAGVTFGGTGEDSLDRFTALIGDPVDVSVGGVESNLTTEQSGALSQLTAWPVALAYYSYENDIGVPEFEIRFTQVENGVVTQLQLHYPAHVVDAALVSLEYQSSESC